MDELSHYLTECNQCEPGYYAHEEAQVECLPCSAGTFAETTGQEGCESCFPGSYASSDGAVNCDPCPAGTYSGWGASVCLDCERGFYCPGATDRIPCNTHWNVNGFEHCLKSGIAN